MITNVLAGVFLFIAGAVTALAYVYKDQIRALLKLQQSGTIDAGQRLVGDARQLINGLRSL